MKKIKCNASQIYPDFQSHGCFDNRRENQPMLEMAASSMRRMEKPEGEVREGEERLAWGSFWTLSPCRGIFPDVAEPFVDFFLVFSSPPDSLFSFDQRF